jgi:hypothetical protein
MVCAAIVGAALTDHSAHPYSLTMNGLDLLTPPATGRRYVVRIESINLVEEGPGGVSALTYTIEDPLAEFTTEEMAVIRFWDHTRDRPEFTGWMQSFDVVPWATAGRSIAVSCVGLESLLDWMVVPSLTIPAGTTVVAAIQCCVANATGVGWPIRAFATTDDFVHGAFSSQANPIGYNAGTTLGEDVVLDGPSLREAINTVIASGQQGAVPTWGRQPKDYASSSVTIDFTSGLRVMPNYLVNNILNVTMPTDYSTMTITDTAAATYASTGLDFNIDDGGVARQVYVKGATPAASGLFSDGSGIVGTVAQLNDNTILTLADAASAASDYLFQFATNVRGSFSLDPTATGFVASGNYRAGGMVTFGADSQVVLVPISFMIAAIHKSWAPGSESWAVDFGGFRPSAMKQLRRLTRAVRS